MEEKKQRTEAERIKQENATFKPKTNTRIKGDQMAHFDVGQGASGMQKYLMRQEQAKEMKAEKQRIEQKVFRSG